MKYCIVGAGIWGCVMAERIASVLKEQVVLVEKRDHIGGNCASFFDEETGIECHKYGSHIFHTNCKKVYDYLLNFTSFNAYRHKVLTQHNGKTYIMPINLMTINALYGTNMTPKEAKLFLEKEAQSFSNKGDVNTLEDKAIGQIGQPLYDAFIKNYTKKQWNKDPKELPASIINRLPIRFNYSFDYFNDPWQGIPLDGYSALFTRILDNPLIEVRLNTPYEAIKHQIPKDALCIYTGQIDALFDYTFGALEWRSLRFEWKKVAIQDFQGTSVMNYADIDTPYTRIHEFKHYHPERTAIFQKDASMLCYEYPENWEPGKECYYPVNDKENSERYQLYAKKASEEGFILGGRLGAYKYWDMDKAVENALHIFETRIKM